MKILYRYLFLELALPFLFCLAACSLLWIIADLFGTLDEFIQQKVSWSIILHFYLAQIPRLLVPVLPVSLLFSSLYTLLDLGRRQELVAMQAGGLGPIFMFSPFAILALILSIVLFYLMAGPANHAEGTRRRILAALRGNPESKNTLQDMVFRDIPNHRVWFIRKLDFRQGKAIGIELLQQDENGRDLEEYFAESGEWVGDHWRLHNVNKTFFQSNSDVKEQKTFVTADLTDDHTSPARMGMVQAPPDELNLPELQRFLKQSELNKSRLAPYRTQIHYTFAYPMIVPVFMIFALALGTGHVRRNTAAGVFNAIFLLLAYIFILNFFLAMGRGNRMTPFLSAWITPVLFGAGAVYLFAQKMGVNPVQRWLEKSRLARLQS